MSIDWSMVFTVLGFIATVLFGFLSIELVKRKKYPGKLTLVKQSTIGLFNNIAKNFNEISITYKSEPIKENVIYLKASIVNDGDIDIDGKNVEKPLNITLNPGLKWIKTKVTCASPELNCNTEITANQTVLNFNFGLIRKKEFFQFESLIETEDSKINAEEIYNSMKISHRISNTQKVNITSLLSEEQITSKKKRIKTFGFTIGGQLIFLLALFLVQMLYLKDSPIYYKDTTNYSYEVKARSDDKIELKNIETKEKRIITVKEFHQ